MLGEGQYRHYTSRYFVNGQLYKADYLMRLAEELKKQPLFFLSITVLVLIVAFFAEMQGLHQPHVKTIYKRELFFLELAFVVLVILNREITFPSVKNFPGLLVALAAYWGVWSLFSAVDAIRPLLALYTYAEHLTLVLFSFSVYALIRKFKYSREILLWVILLGFCFYCLFFGGSYFLFENYNPEINFAATFDEVGFRNIRHLGYYFAIGLVVATGMGVGLGHYYGKAALWIGAVLSVVAWALIFWAGGRGPLVAFFVSLGLIIFLNGGFRQSKQLLLFVAITCFIGAFGSLLIPGGYGIDYLIGKLLWVPEDFSTLIEVEKTPSKRIEMWLTCLNEIKNNPFFGIGQNNFRYGCGKGFPLTLHPHGVHIQAPLEWGIPGAVAFFLLGGAMLWRTFMNVNAAQEGESYALIPLWGVLMLLVASGYDGILYQRYSLMFFALFLAMMMPVKDDLKSDGVRKEDGRLVYYGLLFFVLLLLMILAVADFQFVVEYYEL